MQNYLKYGKISEICGYFAGKKRKKIAPAAPKNLVRIYSPVQDATEHSPPFFRWTVFFSSSPNRFIEVSKS